MYSCTWGSLPRFWRISCCGVFPSCPDSIKPHSHPRRRGKPVSSGWWSHLLGRYCRNIVSTCTTLLTLSKQHPFCIRLTAYCDVDCVAAALGVLAPVHPALPSGGCEHARVRLARASAPIGVILHSLSHFLTCRKVHERPARGVRLERGTADSEALPSEELLAARSQTWRVKRQFLGRLGRLCNTEKWDQRLLLVNT